MKRYIIYNFSRYAEAEAALKHNFPNQSEEMVAAFRGLPDKYKDALMSEGLEDMLLIDRRAYGESLDEEGNRQIDYRNPKPDRTYNVNIFTEGFLSPQRIKSVRAAEKLRASRNPDYQYLKNQVQSSLLFRQAYRGNSTMNSVLSTSVSPADLRRVQRMNAGLTQGENVYVLGKRNPVAKIGGGGVMAAAGDGLPRHLIKLVPASMIARLTKNKAMAEKFRAGEPVVGVNNELLVPHEVAHAKAYRAGKKSKHLYDEEFYANSEAMKAFQGARLSRRGMRHAARIAELSNLSYALAEMYNPALTAYSVANYDMLKRNFPKRYAMNTSAKTRQALYDAWKHYQPSGAGD